MAKLTPEEVRSYVEGLYEKARIAQKEYAKSNQEQLDRVTRAAGKVVYDNARMLAEEAVAETGMGTVEGKIIKMQGSMTNQWHYQKGKASTGVIGWEQGKLDVDCILKIAKPAGIVSALMPSTNPTTNIGANAMHAFKGGNAIIICPHPKAQQVSLHCTELIREAIVALGAPADLIQCCDNVSLDMTQLVMSMSDAILATGGAAMVTAAASCGKPSFGVGQGNCQVIVDKGMSDKFESMAEAAVICRSFDSGLPCTGEQTFIIPAEDEEAIKAAFERNGAYVVTDEAVVAKLREVLFVSNGKGGWKLNADNVGQSAQYLGKLVGLDVPADKRTLFVKITKFGADEPLCREKLCPVTNFYAHDGSWEDGIAVACANLELEGKGHSSDIYTYDKEHELYAGMNLPVCRLIVNNGNMVNSGEPYHMVGTPNTSGLGCGFWQGNSINENLTFYHLLNITRMMYTVDNSSIPELTTEQIWAED